MCQNPYVQACIIINVRVSDPHFFADPGKNLHADPDPGGKGKNEKKID